MVFLWQHYMATNRPGIAIVVFVFGVFVWIKTFLEIVLCSTLYFFNERSKRKKFMTRRQKQAQNKSKRPPSLQLLDANHHVKVTLGILLNHVSHIVGFPGFLWIQSHTDPHAQEKRTHMVGHKSHCQSQPLLLSPPKTSSTPLGAKGFIVSSMCVLCACVNVCMRIHWCTWSAVLGVLSQLCLV